MLGRKSDNPKRREGAGEDRRNEPNIMKRQKRRQENGEKSRVSEAEIELREPARKCRRETGTEEKERSWGKTT